MLEYLRENYVNIILFLIILFIVYKCVLAEKFIVLNHPPHFYTYEPSDYYEVPTCAAWDYNCNAKNGNIRKI